MIFLLAFYLLNAERADYDGKNLTFTGNFQIEHPMGQLKSQKATLEDPHKKGCYLLLEEGVSIEAGQGGAPFSISSKRASCELPPYPLFSLPSFKEILFFDEVEIHTLHGMCAKGGSATYKGGTLTLYPSLPNPYCQLLRGEERIDAREIHFELFKKQLLCTDVRLLSPHFQGKTSIAIADLLFYDVTEQMIRLSSSPPKRVLFWQEHLSLSAPEVLIRFKPEESIEGKGDVHFSFDLEEQNLIETIFAKYL